MLVISRERWIMKKIWLVIMGVILGVFCRNINGVYSAPIDLPRGLQDVKKIPDSQRLMFGLELDAISERKMEHFNAELKGNIITAKAFYSTGYGIDFYGLIGRTQGFEYKIDDLDLVCKWDDDYMLGLGMNMVIFIPVLQENMIWPFIDLKYRAIKDVDYDSINVGGAAQANVVNNISTDWWERQLSLGIAKKYEMLIAYTGIKYSDVHIACDVDVGGVNYKGYNDADYNYGIFIGCMVPMEKVKIGLEVRLVDEQAVTCKVHYQF